MTRYALFFVAFILIFLAACDSVPPMAEPSEFVAVVEGETAVSSSPAPTNSATSTLAPSANPTQIPAPTNTPSATSTVEPTVTAEPSLIPPTPTVALWTGIGTPMPVVQDVISPENAAQIQELGRWGKGSIKNAHYSSDGKQLIVATAFGVYFYDAETAQLLQFFQAREELTAFSLSDDENLLAIGYKWPGSIDVFEVDTGNLLLTIDTEHTVGSLIFSSDQKSLIANIYYNYGCR